MDTQIKYYLYIPPLPPRPYHSIIKELCICLLECRRGGEGGSEGIAYLYFASIYQQLIPEKNSLPPCNTYLRNSHGQENVL